MPPPPAEAVASMLSPGAPSRDSKINRDLLSVLEALKQLALAPADG